MEEWALNQLGINSHKPWVSQSCQAKNIHNLVLAFFVLYDRNAAWTGFLNKYSEFDINKQKEEHWEFYWGVLDTDQIQADIY